MRQYLAKTADIPAGQGKTFLIDGKKIIVLHMNGALRAYVSYCPHQGGSVRVIDGGRKLQCNWHGAQFDAATGIVQTGPAPEGASLEAVELTVENGTVYAEMKAKAASSWADDF